MSNCLEGEYLRKMQKKKKQSATGTPNLQMSALQSESV